MTSFSFRSRRWHPPLLSAALPACLTCLNPANTPPVSPVFTVAQLQSTPWPPLASSSVVVINSCIDLYKKASSLRSKLPGSSCASTAKRHNLPDHYVDRHGVYYIPTLFSPTRIRNALRRKHLFLCHVFLSRQSRQSNHQSARCMSIWSTYVPTLQPHRSLLRPPRRLFTSPLTQHPANPSSV